MKILHWQLLYYVHSLMLLLVIFIAVLLRLEGLLLKWLEFNHWTVLLRPKRDEMSRNKSSDDAAEQYYLLSIWRSHRYGTPGLPYKAGAMKHLACQ